MKHPVILVVEDERPLQEVIRKKLELSEFEVVTARTIEQAITYLEDISEIEVVWLDHYLLGKENGIDFVVAVKNHAEWQKIPIFVVSNTASPDKVQSYIQLGVNKFYTKSDFRLDEIISEIKQAILSPE